MISTEYKNTLTSVLAVVITIIIMIQQLDTAVIDKWMIGNVIILSSVIVAETSLDYNKKMLVLIISVTWIGATLIQQLSKKATENKDCKGWSWDFLNGNPMIKWKKDGDGDYLTQNERAMVFFVLSYLFTVIMLMIILLSKMDSEVPILGFLNDNLKYLFVIMLPIIVVFVNEINILSSIYGSGSSIPMTSDVLFNRLVTGNFEWGESDTSSSNKYIVRTITTTLFLLLLFILFMNYSTGGSIALFSDTLGVGSSNIPIYIMLFILLFFNFVIESLFLQKCSFKEETSNKGSNKNNEAFGCRVAKYGGIVTLLYISYTVSILYQINGTRDKLFALLFIIALTFGFGEFMISMKDDKSTKSS